MKKKLAVLLALCLTLGALPLSALAATFKGTLPDGREIAIEVDDESLEVTLPADVTDYYAAAPARLNMDRTATITLAPTDYYGTAPETIEIIATPAVVASTEVNGNEADFSQEVLTVDSTTTDVILNVTGTVTSTVEVKLPTSLTAAELAKNDVSDEAIVTVNTTVANVALPVEALKQATTSSVTITTVTETKVIKGISIVLPGLTKPLDNPIEITLQSVTTTDTSFFAYRNTSSDPWIRARAVMDKLGNAIFKTRHLTEFAVVDGETVNPDTLAVTDESTGTKAAGAKVEAEPGDQLVFAYNRIIKGEAVADKSIKEVPDYGKKLLTIRDSQTATGSDGSIELAGVYAIAGDAEVTFTDKEGFKFEDSALIAAFGDSNEGIA